MPGGPKAGKQKSQLVRPRNPNQPPQGGPSQIPRYWSRCSISSAQAPMKPAVILVPVVSEKHQTKHPINHLRAPVSIPITDPLLCWIHPVSFLSSLSKLKNLLCPLLVLSWSWEWNPFLSITKASPVIIANVQRSGALNVFPGRKYLMKLVNCFPDHLWRWSTMTQVSGQKWSPHQPKWVPFLPPLGENWSSNASFFNDL